jgi:hypothetical protein
MTRTLVMNFFPLHHQQPSPKFLPNPSPSTRLAFCRLPRQRSDSIRHLQLLFRAMHHILRTPLPKRCHRAFSTIPPSRRTTASKALFRRAGYVVLLGATGYVVDREFYASTAMRNLRTFWTVRIISTKKGRSIDRLPAVRHHCRRLQVKFYTGQE